MKNEVDRKKGELRAACAIGEESPAMRRVRIGDVARPAAAAVVMLMIGFALGAVFWELPWVGDALREKYPSLFLCHIKTDPEVYLRRDLIEKQKTLVRRFDKGTVRKLFGYSR